MIGYVTLAVVMGLLAVVFGVIAILAWKKYKIFRSKWENEENRTHLLKNKNEELVAELNGKNQQLAIYNEDFNSIEEMKRTKSAMERNNGELIESNSRLLAESKVLRDEYYKAQNSFQEVINQRDALLEEVRQIEGRIPPASNEREALERALQKLREADVLLMQEHKQTLIRLEQERNELANQSGFVLRFTGKEAAEIRALKPILELLSNPAPLNKAIYEMYYRDNMKVLLGQAGLLERKTGIYRLWQEMDDGSIVNYVGQSVDIGERWYQHLKRFVGSEPATGVRLYKDERVDLEKLHWEVLEVFTQEQLDAIPKLMNDRERYWIEFYNGMGGWNSK